MGGRRVSGGGRSHRPNPMQIAGLVISLALIITAVVIVFTSLAPMIFHKTPSGDASGSGQSSNSQSTQGTEVTLNSLTLSRTKWRFRRGSPTSSSRLPIRQTLRSQWSGPAVMRMWPLWTSSAT